MCDLASKLDSLSLSDRCGMIGYISRVKKSKKYFKCPENYFVLPDIEGSKLILCKRQSAIEDDVFICFQCTDMTIFKNLRNVDKIKSIKDEYCNHAKLCSVLFDTKNDKPFDAVNEIEILRKNPSEIIALVFPNLSDKVKNPGVLVLNSRMSKPKCHTCEGKKCIHVNTYLLKGNVDDDENLPIGKMKCVGKK